MRTPLTNRSWQVIVTGTAALCCAAAITGCGGSGQQDAHNASAAASTGASTAAPRTSSTAAPSTPGEHGNTTGAAPSSTLPQSSSSSSSADGEGSDDDGIDPSQAAASGITPTPASALEAKQWAAAVRCAEGFTKAFARRPHDSQSAWWIRTKPFLTDQMAQVYKYTSVQNVTVTKVTGKATVMPIVGVPVDVGLPVRVPTNIGTLTITTITDESGVHVNQVQFPGDSS